MITITHHRATLQVLPEHAQATHDLLALIDKSKGRKGRKFKRTIDPKLNSMTRYYPVFTPGMTTGEYIAQYNKLNAKLYLHFVAFDHADRAAPMFDPAVPEVEVLEEVDA